MPVGALLPLLGDNGVFLSFPVGKNPYGAPLNFH